jgi:hypothetical protein
MRIGLLLVGLTMTNDGPENWLSLPKSILAIPRLLRQTKRSTKMTKNNERSIEQTIESRPVGRRLNASGHSVADGTDLGVSR